jgi:hypothetical protein
MKNQIIFDSLVTLLKGTNPDEESALQLVIILTVAELKEIKTEAVEQGKLQVVLFLEKLSERLRYSMSGPGADAKHTHPGLDGQLKASDSDFEKIAALNLKKSDQYVLEAAQAAARHSQPKVRKKLLENILDKSNKLAEDRPVYQGQAMEVVRIYLKATRG